MQKNLISCWKVEKEFHLDCISDSSVCVCSLTFFLILFNYVFSIPTIIEFFILKMTRLTYRTFY